MRNWIPRSLKGAIVLLACFAASAFAQSVGMQLETAGAGYVMGGVYTSPYGLSINGGPTTPLICDDFTTDVSLNQKWTATETSLTALDAGTNPLGTPKFTPGDLQNYATAAVLAAELMTLPNLYSEQAGELSYAIWGIFDPSLLQSTKANPYGADPYGTLTSAEFTAANDYLTAAQVLVAQASGDITKISVNGYSITGLTIYTPNPVSASQEFLQVSMAEPPYPALLAVDLLAVVGLILFVRRRRPV